MKKLNSILIDINHPGHIHLFKNLIYLLKSEGIKVFVTIKDVDNLKKLLQLYNIDYILIGKKSDSIKGKFFNQIKYVKELVKLINKNDIMLGIGVSITLAHASKLSKMVSLILDDDDSAVEPLFAKFAHPFADYLISPDVLNFERKRKNHLTYAGYHELAYLHPNRFKPDLNVLNESGLDNNEPFFILRFNAFKAHHDVGAKGLTVNQKRELISMLNKKGKIFITSEKEIEPEFEIYKIKISPDKIHSLIHFASLLIGDSQTMTYEEAVLGTPYLRCNSFVGKISYLEEEEHKYGLTFGFLPENYAGLLTKAQELLNIKNLKSIWQDKKLTLISDKIDVTAFLFWLITNYPESIIQHKKDKFFQYNFK